MSKEIVQCMGGWCTKRDKCAHYVAAPINGREPVERLCGDAEEPERLVRVVELEEVAE